MTQKAILCCSNNPDFHVIYSVSGSEKSYLVCSNCISLDCFSKYILEKTPIRAQPKKIFQNEITDENVETEIIDERFGETVERDENLPEQIEKERLQFYPKNKRGAKL